MAFFKGSYYENIPRFSPNDKGQTVFDGLRARPLNKPEPVLEHIVSLKERLDSIAHHYYAESRDWRRIVETNPDVLFPEDLLFTPEPIEENGRERIGHVILIPRRKEAR
ncbi:MAG: hypothetical protein NPIRA02_09720 [Nitrospirales bacterium]|nr:MAG: hypothetical protein NPIRA02_09720 [Nitrospirales bacterium]